MEREKKCGKTRGTLASSRAIARAETIKKFAPLFPLFASLSYRQCFRGLEPRDARRTRRARLHLLLCFQAKRRSRKKANRKKNRSRLFAFDEEKWRARATFLTLSFPSLFLPPTLCRWAFPPLWPSHCRGRSVVSRDRCRSRRAMADPAAAPVRPANASTPASNRADPRRCHRSQFHARVRADALARQRAARGEGLDAARAEAAARRSQQQGGGEAHAIEVDAASVPSSSSSLPAAAVEVEREAGGAAASSSSTSAAAAAPRPFWARQLMRHEWMVDVPEDLASNW